MINLLSRSVDEGRVRENCVRLEKSKLNLDDRTEVSQSRAIVDARRYPRYRLQVTICVYPRESEVVRGETVDISESGISAMLRVEVPVGEVVRLVFTVPSGDIEVHAMVRQRCAFRYGFQFVEDSGAQALIERTCRELALEQAWSER